MVVSLSSSCPTSPKSMQKDQPNFIAWRCAFFIPAFFQILIGLAVLVLGQDLPDGNFSELRKGDMAKPKGHMQFISTVYQLPHLDHALDLWVRWPLLLTVSIGL